MFFARFIAEMHCFRAFFEKTLILFSIPMQDPSLPEGKTGGIKNLHSTIK